jgi:hypothetical protein
VEYFHEFVGIPVIPWFSIGILWNMNLEFLIKIM